MQPKPTIIATLAVSVTFAIAIVLCDRWTEGTRWNPAVTYTLISLWFIPFSILTVAPTIGRNRFPRV